MYSDNKYNEERYNRKKNFSHWGLAFQQIKLNHILLVMLLPIVAITIGIWVKMDFFLAIFDAPKLIRPIYEMSIKTLGVIIPILLAWAVMEVIGSLTARKDEQSILMAFDEKELRNGSPILMYKSKDKRRGYIRRVWYSPIPLDIWIERQERIEHQMKETIIKELDYDERAKDNRIVMVSLKGMKRVKEEKPFFDNELEKDMENY
ncbi:MAG: hypothetical protein E7305_09770 [Butyrivibrio sp.]|nr:hypothetical protein [Butyrivibrio sp.]